MATLFAPARRAWTEERIFFTSMAVALLAFAFAGFAHSYYLMSFTEARPLPPLVHFHGVLCTAWMVLLVTQSGLIAAHRANLHRLIGPAGAVLAIGIVAIGLQVAIDRSRPPRFYSAEAFLIFPLMAIGVFALFATLGVVNRRNAAAHKRLMLLATFSLVVPAGARIASGLQPSILPPGSIGGMILTDLFLAALVAFDFRARGRLHPVTLWGGGLFLVSQPLRVLVAQSEAWQGFARGLIG